jgi:multisubunit Na+/H+ antiporter MnhF subunit
MAKLTMFFGALLLALGAGAYFLLPSHSLHTLIPAAFGLLIVLFGALANTDVPKKRMLFMHIAVTIGLLGFLGTIPGIIGVIHMAAGQVVARPEAAKVQALMGTICLIFVLLCVRSFIAARRLRTA